MKKSFTIYFVLFIFFTTTGFAQRRESDTNQWSNVPLFPGDSMTFTLPVKGKEGDTKSVTVTLLKTNPLKITFQRAGSNEKLEMLLPENQKRSGTFSVYYDLVFEIHFDQTQAGLNSLEFMKYVKVTATSQPDHYELSAAPLEVNFMLSIMNPVQIGEWLLKLQTKEITGFSDFSHYQIILQNTKTNTQKTLSAADGTTYQFDRARFATRIPPYHQTKTIYMQAQFDADFSARGKNAFIQSDSISLSLNGVSISGFFDKMGNQYGFSVEWANEANPAVDDIRKHPLHRLGQYHQSESFRLSQINPRTVEYALDSIVAEAAQRNTNFSLALEWKDDTHLMIHVHDIEGYIQQQQEEQERKQKFDEAKAKIELLFQQKYQPSTKIIPLKKISAQTAQQLVSQKLNLYFIGLSSNYEHATIVEDTELTDIFSAPVEMKDNIFTQGRISTFAVESVIADEKTNTLIANITENTYKEILKTLAMTESIVTDEPQAKTKPSTYTVEVLLLEGVTQNGSSEIPTAVGEKKIVNINEYGVDPDDLKFFQFDHFVELGKGMVSIFAETGEIGTATVALSENYQCRLQFQDLREPYLILQGNLIGTESDKPLLQNTIFLEQDNYSLLGITNLKQALILVLRVHGSIETNEKIDY